MDHKDELARYLAQARDAMVWKLEGLSEYDARRPLTATSTNLLGIVKHVALVQIGYLGHVFDRPVADPSVLEAMHEPNADMFAAAEESRSDILTLFRQSNEHADATISALPLDGAGTVPWWGENGSVTLHLILIHMLTEMNRHLGHMDILREQLDGEVGHREGVDNMPDADREWWSAYVASLEAIAESFRPA